LLLMPRYNPYDLQLQITRMFVEGQDFFAVTKVQDWLQYLRQNPNDFEIRFRKKAASADSGLPYNIEVVLSRKDGEPVDPFLLEQLSQQQQA
jgi:hypothetical protein